MNTQLDINEQLIQQALLVAGINNPQNVIELALTEFIARHKANEKLKRESPNINELPSIRSEPAFGMWKDREEIPTNSRIWLEQLRKQQWEHK